MWQIPHGGPVHTKSELTHVMCAYDLSPERLLRKRPAQPHSSADLQLGRQKRRVYEDEVAVGKVRSIYAVASKTAESSEGRKTTDGQCVPNNGIQERYAGRQL